MFQSYRARIWSTGTGQVISVPSSVARAGNYIKGEEVEVTLMHGATRDIHVKPAMSLYGFFGLSSFDRPRFPSDKVTFDLRGPISGGGSATYPVRIGSMKISGVRPFMPPHGPIKEGSVIRIRPVVPNRLYEIEIQQPPGGAAIAQMSDKARLE